jgi:hypothetical protein
MTDYIRCDCDNTFPVFDAKPYVRYMSCIKCRKVWMIKFSGRRLVEVDFSQGSETVSHWPHKPK